MTTRRLRTALTALAATAVLTAAPALAAQAYAPTPRTLYQLPSDQPCLKGRGNCAIYPKAAQLPSGRLVAAFEKATVVPSSGSAAGETIPIYKSDDDGTTWQTLAEVKAPAYASSDSRYAKYTSNWTNPYFYVLPSAVGDLRAGTALMATVVSGDDAYYKQRKAADPNWTPTGDGDRSDLAIALYASTDNGASWAFLNIIATGGWQGGSAGNIGTFANANTNRQVDPIWEPYLMVYQGKLVAYYSDENDYTGYNTTTGVPTLDPANTSRADSTGQVLVHKTWDGTSATWSAPVIDVAGTSYTTPSGQVQIGGGRPGMENIVQTSDGKWMVTYEYFGGGDNVHYKIADDPLSFYKVGGAAGADITSLPVAAGSGRLSTGGSPVIIRLPDGRLVYNANQSGSVWVNTSGRSDGTWTEYQTTVGNGYSRNLTYDSRTGRVLILRNQGESQLVYAEVDLGRSAGTYYQIKNVRTGQVIGTSGNTTDANIGNGNTPDVRLETPGSASNPDTQLWHVLTKADGNVSLINKSGGRAAEVWTGSATPGQRIAQWVDDTDKGLFTMVRKANGTVYFQSTQNPSLYLTSAAAGAPLTLAVSDNGAGAQDFQLVAG